MFRTLRALVIAVVVAVSLLGSASIASADELGFNVHIKPLPSIRVDITWE
jgi:hypothetical protein